MKRIFLLLFLSVISVGVASAGDTTVKVKMSDELGGDETTTFTPDTEKIYALFATEGAKKGDKLRGVLIAEDVGDVAPPNTKVLETKLDVEGDTDDGDFNFSKPTKGWPVGKYRVEIYVNGGLADLVKFTITPGVMIEVPKGDKE